MTEDVDPIRILTSARDKLIEERRSLAVAIALGYRRRRSDDPQTNGLREAFVGVQSLIEAVDRAVAHEKTISQEAVGAAPEFSAAQLALASPLQNGRL